MVNPLPLAQSVSSLGEAAAPFWRLYRRKGPPSLFLLLCLNLIIAPAVQGATGPQLLRTQAYALGILGLVTILLSGYLFVVMFQPERF